MARIPVTTHWVYHRVELLMIWFMQCHCCSLCSMIQIFTLIWWRTVHHDVMQAIYEAWGNTWALWCLLHYSSCSGTTLQSLIRNYSNIDSWTPLLTTMHINAIWYSNWVLYFITLLAVAMLQSLMRNYMVDSEFCIGYCPWLLDFLCIQIFLWWYFLCGEFQLIFSVCISWK